MAAQPPQRHRRNASPRAGPQPMRATLPFTLRQSSPIRGSNGRRSSPGPASSPTQHWPDNNKKHSRRSPDHKTSPERSPSTPGFRGKRLHILFLSRNFSVEYQAISNVFVRPSQFCELVRTRRGYLLFLWPFSPPFLASYKFADRPPLVQIVLFQNFDKIWWFSWKTRKILAFQFCLVWKMPAGSIHHVTGAICMCADEVIREPQRWYSSLTHVQVLRKGKLWMKSGTWILYMFI